MKQKVDTIDLHEGITLQSLIDSIKNRGQHDLSEVTVKMTYEPCGVDHGDDYYYCPTAYSDIRVEWKIS